MLMNKRINIVSIIIYVLIFSLGSCFGKLLNWGYFVLSNEISIFDAFSLIVTIGLAIYIAKVIEKGVQDDRIEKDLFLNHLEQIEKPLLAIDDILDSQDALYSTIVGSFSKSNKEHYKFFKRVNDKSILRDKIRINSYEKQIDDNFKSLKPLLTDTPKNQTENKDIVMENGTIKYSEGRKTEIHNALSEILDALFTIKIIINRS